jgi:hypothetical protein
MTISGDSAGDRLDVLDAAEYQQLMRREALRPLQSLPCLHDQITGRPIT